MNEENYIIDIPTDVRTYPDVGINSNIYKSFPEATDAAIKWSKQDGVPVNIYKLVLIGTINP